MRRFYVTFEVSALTEAGDVDGAGSEAMIDATLDLLLDRPALIDPDAGAELSSGKVEFMAVIDADTPERAVAIVGEHLRECVARALNGIGTGLRVEFRCATAVEQPAISAAS